LCLDRNKVQLKLDKLDFGVTNHCARNCREACGKRCKTGFICKVTFKVTPKSWASTLKRVQPYYEPKLFQHQQSVKAGVSLGIRQASGTLSGTKTKVSLSPIAEYGWSAAQIDSDQSVSWPWKVNTFSNGTTLEFDKTTWLTRPVLGIQPGRMNLAPEPVEASWELPSNSQLRSEEPKWDLTVTLHTASLKPKRRLPGYKAVLGPKIIYVGVLDFSLAEDVILQGLTVETN
jgi:hypothetical protein